MRTLNILLCLLISFLIISCGQETQSISNSVEGGETVCDRVELSEWSKKLKETDGVILDVRTEPEFKQGHIPNAVNIDFQSTEFIAKLQELDKDKTYLMHCASGGRSAKTLAKMKALGFVEVYELAGGFNAWQSAGMEVVTL